CSRRVKRRSAEPAKHEYERDGTHIWRKSDQGDGRDAYDRSGEQQTSRPPPVGDVPEPELRDGIRELKEHLQRASRCEREIQVEDEQRQQRREDVAEAVHDEVRARQDEDGGMQPERTEFHLDRRPSRRATSAIPALNSRMRSSQDATPSTTSDTPIVIDRRTICTTSAPPGQRASSIWFSAAATSPIAPAAAVILANAPRMRPSWMPCRWLRRTRRSVTALNSAAIEVPSASPRNPSTRTSTTLSPAFTSTVMILTVTG